MTFLFNTSISSHEQVKIWTLKKYFLSCKAENPLVYYLSYWELIFRLLGLLGLIKGVTSPHCKLLSRDNFYSWIYFCAFLPCAAIQTIKITTEDQTENDPKVMNPNNNQQFPPPVLYHMPQIMQGKLSNHIWLKMIKDFRRIKMTYRFVVETSYILREPNGCMGK